MIRQILMWYYRHEHARYVRFERQSIERAISDGEIAREFLARIAALREVAQ